MIIESSRKGFEAKQEGDIDNNIEKFSKAAASSSSRQWAAFRNPRIVRVSRSFGGKDRHSKVCTIRGLRDRRIRLSVPTAVQLYDLQHRLGLTQPSKVIDWLLDATKLDIDKLPPLPIPQGFNFPHSFHHQQILLPPHHESIASSHHQCSLGGFYDANSNFMKDEGGQNLMAKSRCWDIGKGSISEKGKWIRTNSIEQENQDGIIGGYNRMQVSAQNLFPIGSIHSPLPALLNNNAMSYNNNSFHLEPSTLSLSQFGGHGLFPSQVDPNSGNNGVPFATTPSLFTPYAPSFMATSSVESDPKVQFNHIQFLSSSSNNSQALPHHHPLIPSLHSPLRPLPTPFISKLVDSDYHNNNPSQPDKSSSTRS